MERNRNAHEMWLRGEPSEVEAELDSVPAGAPPDETPWPTPLWDNSTGCLEAIRDALVAKGLANGAA